MVEEFPYSLGHPILHLFDRPSDFLDNPVDVRRMSSCFLSKSLPSDGFERLGQTTILSQPLAVELLHVRSTVSSLLPDCDSPLHEREEPPMRQMRENCQTKHELRVAHQPQAEERGATHRPLGVVEEPVDASVGQLRWNLLDQEKIRV